jgi:hypothetical protein
MEITIYGYSIGFNRNKIGWTLVVRYPSNGGLMNIVYPLYRVVE